MKRKYCIGFFTGIFLLICAIGIGYQASYKYVMGRQKAEAQIQKEHVNSITTKGEATKNEGYYLCELHGYVVVYLEDKKTIFEVTDILLSELPQEVQGEISSGKYIETENALYGFLENYSS